MLKEENNCYPYPDGAIYVIEGGWGKVMEKKHRVGIVGKDVRCFPKGFFFPKRQLPQVATSN